MARLIRGEDPKIDKINDLVDNVLRDNNDSASMAELLKMFHPMMLKICKKWSIHFNDEYHKLIPFDNLLSEAQSWFAQYTLTKYVVDGKATYNKFILDHVDQRIRYIYECELKFYKNVVLPDPDKTKDVNENDRMEMFEYVAYNYCSDHDNGIEDDVLDDIEVHSRVELAHKIMELLDNEEIFKPRDKLIFISIAYNGITHEQVGDDLNISRARVSQIYQKIKKKLYNLIEGDEEIWKLICENDIEFEER